MRRTLLLVLVVVAAMAARADARPKKQVRYVGLHPVPRAHGGGLCEIEAPHVHLYTPSDAKVHYRDHRGALYFVGDPVAYGWDGPKHAYVGHHPIFVGEVVGPIDGTVEIDPEFCYLDGPHYHAFAPPEAIEAEFVVQGDAFFYVGTPPPMYVEARPTLIAINAIYDDLTYTRPVVSLTPPSAWIGIRFAAPAFVAPVRVRAARSRVHVVAPVIEIVPPAYEVELVAPVIIEHRHEHRRIRKYERKGDKVEIHY